MKKTLSTLAIAASIAFSSQAFAGNDIDSMIEKATKLHNEAKGTIVWKQKAMKESYFDTYMGEIKAAQEKGDMAKAKAAAELLLKTAEGEHKQATESIKAGWEK